ncbi:unnamed protein product [marine sediment metagenome]|uniref:Uncharacterized protein n=1 Tax=marine sediment metagenome TaxID=412755 RepID=X0WIG8_9ZZZZ
MDLASLVCAWLADRIVTSKEERGAEDRLQAEIDRLKVEIEDLKDEKDT